MKRNEIHEAVNLTGLVLAEAVVLWLFLGSDKVALLWKFIGAPFLFLLTAYVFHRVGPKITGPVINRLLRNEGSGPLP